MIDFIKSHQNYSYTCSYKDKKERRGDRKGTGREEENKEKINMSKHCGWSVPCILYNITVCVQTNAQCINVHCAFVGQI